MNKKLTIISIMIMVLCLSTLGAAPYYDSGSQIFNITAGTNVPLSATSYSSAEEKFVTTFGPGNDNTHFLMGGYGSLNYEAFINPYFSLGGELGYQFNIIADGKTFSNVPILFRATYVPVQGTWEIPISIGLGLNYMSYGGNSKISFTSHLNFGARYFFTENWGVGLSTGISYVPELYQDYKKNGHLTFIPINAVVSYRH